MRKALAVCCVMLLAAEVLPAGVARGGGGSRVNVQNRSAVNQNANVKRNVNNANVNRNVNNTNVNRNVNNTNVNVNRNVNVNSGYYGGYRGPVVVEDNGWNAGSFAAGAAVGAVTGAVVGAATAPKSTTTVVAVPAMGTVITALPGGCQTVSGAGGVIYNCSNVYYQPSYQGTTLVYQVVKYP